MNGFIPAPGAPQPKKRRLFVAAVFGVLIIGAPLFDAFATRGEIYPHVRVAAVEIGGQSTASARKELQARFEEFSNTPLTFIADSTRAAVPLADIVSFDVDATISQAQTIGNSGSSLKRFNERLTARVSGITIAPVVDLNEEVLSKTLHEAFASIESDPKNAAFAVTFQDGKATVTITPDVSGNMIDMESVAKKLTEYASTLTLAPLELALQPISAEIMTDDLLKQVDEAETLFKHGAPEVTLQDKKWMISYETLADWLTAKKDGDKIAVALDEVKIATWLDTIVKEVERKPINAIFELSEDGKKVIEFDLGTPGIELPREENAAAIASAILAQKPIALAVKELAPRVTPQKGAADFGIKELVGRGTTSFKGSPVNRVKNIKRGAAILDGTLIAPGEEFSLLEHLRPFTEENGYLPELVIKASEGRTTPEIGGGLCQIGTTMFRVVLNAGLPVTARANHSYRVSYYEPPVGMDATIYDPAPDFKFINDTGNWLLLTTHVSGSTLTFDLWGTKDGRIAKTTEPEISNIKKPPEKKIIETTELPPGKTKCTEKAHIGSDARFTYIVTYADGTVKEKEFFSRYRPWQEVCLLGVEKLTAPEPLPEEVPLTPDTAPPIVVQN
ncbi:hypothetical protein A3B21_04790 [Candidatus Uhrbacteria bacterium RIFCSPLOWO2_01_FULL_47_24]|uniref:YoaR-like putative peptidoglycan binding domain-containing protein n=1 Tax=Candidatus Uhrbacteria bacterium RIFCSPLOWO2_01_FULL_47_24 TaxID=1802401 RepID=A0A1F7UUR7_9BACT|nr:MAG: hypothetical protein A2753_00410 [Candidatus Uhrbacteria bacterium RIFCSPHIGHO2_01_FULL_47_11]OGL69270.1 MAG: hypothetical protein A3D58_03175 [Candidatus Uhrbacteria bacterium RIFCSPHIGHO2_02_FULL_46_47]OGL76912.1 MAG: hypothetical protein A3F52_00510 [Candidatus Uhrbacteria bacterium RIFCSPHIGHO2_12_FULL_47_11]OGL82006.1 MAG: hypothetical protein A3B21_04790 [Candidatus Uhrbacteria bacterium RIFCSPLOWO2_01_FULL_47_24]OGL85400.1 MAG: hypothetical protein A3J03_04955 [Candidatus Uhrbact